jgi:hypothetical protein
MNLVSPCGWDSDFATRRDLDYETENTPYIEWLARLGPENPSDPGDDESVVRTFMKAPVESDVCTPQADKVEAFCAGTSLQSLRTEKWKGNKPLPQVALLHERNFKDGTPRSRTYRGPLTAHSLYQELKKPVRAAFPRDPGKKKWGEAD